MTALASILEMTDVEAGYGKFTVLDRVSLRLAGDEILAVLGANGSGKSTALKTIIGLTQMSAGNIRFQGQEIGRLAAHRRAGLGIGYVPQVQNVFPDLTVADNLRMGAFLRPRELDRAQDRVFALFPRLAERRKQIAGRLSGGERRMLSIGMTLLLEPKALLLDEPSSDLAPAMIETVFSALTAIRRQLRIPIMLVEQNVNQALTIADRVTVLVRGRQALEQAAGQIDPEDLRNLFVDGSVSARGPA